MKDIQTNQLFKSKTGNKFIILWKYPTNGKPCFKCLFFDKDGYPEIKDMYQSYIDKCSYIKDINIKD
jgi:hypothetical protein